MIERERQSILAELTPPFTVIEPRVQTVPFVLCSPHSGRVYPSALTAASRLGPEALRKSEDCFVDDLVANIVALGAPLIAARFPRAYLDVNREAGELDPELFLGRLPAGSNAGSLRVGSGLGVVARVVADGEEIYRQRLPLEIALERIERLYRPFHRALAGLLKRTLARFGIAVLVDCHSMPSASVAEPRTERADVVIGDRFGVSCDPRLTRLAQSTLAGLGFATQLNRPYAGGFITEHYGRPRTGVHAIQIEINRGLYLDEAAFRPTLGFDGLREDLTRFAERLFADGPAILSRRAAAE